MLKIARAPYVFCPSVVVNTPSSIVAPSGDGTPRQAWAAAPLGTSRIVRTAPMAMLRIRPPGVWRFVPGLEVSSRGGAWKLLMVASQGPVIPFRGALEY